MRYPIPAIIGAAMLLSGCDALVSARSDIIDTGAQLNDEAVTSAEIVLCRAASVGSIERRFMRSPEDWELWNQLCRGEGPMPLPDPLSLSP